MFAKAKTALVLVAVLLVSLISLPVHAQDGLTIPPGTPIAVGDTVEGQLSADAPIVAYTFEGAAGDAISAYVEDDTTTATYLVLANAAGEILHARSLDLAYRYAAWMPVYILPEDGTYSLAVTTSNYFYLQEPGDDASYSMTLEAAEYELITYADVIEGELSAEDGAHVYVFEGKITEIPYLVLESAGNRLEVDSLTDPEAGENSGNTPPGSDNVYISPFYMLEDETYSVVVYNGMIFDGTVPYTLTLEQYEPTPISGGETVGVEMAVETLTNYLSFEGTTGQLASISAVGPESLTLTLAIVDADGQIVAVAENNESIEEARLPQDGTYLIVVIPGDFLIESDDLGAIEVTLELQ